MTVKLDQRGMDRSPARRTLCHLPSACHPAVTSGQALSLDLCLAWVNEHQDQADEHAKRAAQAATSSNPEAHGFVAAAGRPLSLPRFEGRFAAGLTAIARRGSYP